MCGVGSVYGVCVWCGECVCGVGSVCVCGECVRGVESVCAVWGVCVSV